MIVVSIVGILFRLNSISVGIRQIKLGMVCIMFSIGMVMWWNQFDLVVSIFIGILIIIEISVVISISVSVCMV